VTAAKRLLDAAAQAHQEADEGDNQEYDEQYLRDAGRADRNAAESEKRRDQGDNEKYNSIMKHERTYLMKNAIRRCGTVRVAPGASQSVPGLARRRK
jgi:hypothetical protein